MLKSHPLSKNCCSSSLLHYEKKQKEIPPPIVFMATRKNEPKPSLIVIMAVRINYLYNKQTSSKC
jgi:hypothetical protein